MTTIEADTALLARFRAGDGSALGALFDRYEGPLFRFLFGMLKDRHKAEDALQETFVQVLRFAEAAGAESFRGWLFTVAHRQALLAKRRAKVSLAESLLGALAARDESPEDAAARADDARLLTELLAKLPSSQRAVIQLRVLHGLKFAEIAARLGCPLGTALARMHAGLASLRQSWELRHA